MDASTIITIIVLVILVVQTWIYEDFTHKQADSLEAKQYEIDTLKAKLVSLQADANVAFFDHRGSKR